MNKDLRYLATGMLPLLLSTYSYATGQNAADTLVVTASGYQQKIINAPASVTVISRERLQQQRYSNLADALADVEGVDVNGRKGKTGGLNISIRGMPSSYTLILIDGRRQNVSGNVTPNGFGETATSFMPPLESIERIEVIRGPMSTLYGSDAMGGVVNIITRKVGKVWNSSLTLDHTFQQNRDAGSTSNLSFYTNGPLLEDRLGIALRGSLFNRAASQLKSSNSDAIISSRGPSPVKADIYTLGTRLTFTPNAQHDLWLDLDRARQTYDNSQGQLGTLDIGNRSRGYQEQLRFDRDEFTLGHTGRFDFGILESSLMQKQTVTHGRTIPNDADPLRAGQPRRLKSNDLILDSKFYTPLGDSHMLTIGGQWLDARLQDGLIADRLSQSSRALFTEDEWQLTDNLSLTGGLRYDHHDAFGGHYSPRAYLVWNSTPEWTFKGGISRGYMTPSLNALHNGINGISGQGTIIIIGNPDLQPETSTSTEVGAYYTGEKGLNANATLFHNRFSNKISRGDPAINCANSPAPGCINVAGVGSKQATFSRSINVDEAVIQGVEMAMTLPLLKSLSLQTNYTYTDSEQRSGKNRGARLTNVPRHMANGRLSWQASERVQSWLRMELRGDSDRFTSRYENLSAQSKAAYDVQGNTLKGYALFHLGGAYKISDNVTLNATVYNLLDRDFLSYSTYRYKGQDYYVSDNSIVQEGRRLWLSTNVTF